jgi:hypothetical protein
MFEWKKKRGLVMPLEMFFCPLGRKMLLILAE